VVRAYLSLFYYVPLLQHQPLLIKLSHSLLDTTLSSFSGLGFPTSFKGKYRFFLLVGNESIEEFYLLGYNAV
jgi:hypothetical protein